jgi:hypothetical protein
MWLPILLLSVSNVAICAYLSISDALIWLCDATVNTAPTLSSVSVFPSTQVRATTDLTCTLGTTTDPDGDTAFTYAFRWYRWQNFTFYPNGTLKNYTRVLVSQLSQPSPPTLRPLLHCNDLTKLVIRSH